MKKCIVLAAVLAVLASCASLDAARDEGDARWLADLMAAGNAAELGKSSSVPFLLDGEIVILGTDISAFWESAVKADLGMQDAKLNAVVPAAGDGYKEFADTFDVKTFFTKYAGKDARILRIVSSSGKRMLVIVGTEGFSRKIYGFRGPF
jgi:hypothetical protein